MNNCKPLINRPPPLKGLNIRIPIEIPIEEGVVINKAPTLQSNCTYDRSIAGDNMDYSTLGYTLGSIITISGISKRHEPESKRKVSPLLSSIGVQGLGSKLLVSP